MPNLKFMERYRTFANVVGMDSVAKDAFSNPIARMGYGTASVAEGVDYILNRWTNDYWLMITLFRNHWIPRKVVEIPAKDMVKAWPRLNCKLTPEQIANFDRTIKRTLTQKKIKRSLTWARLFGGAGALMVIKGHEDILDKPLNLDEVNPDSYKGLIVFDRWSGISPIGNQQQDVESPLTFGLPEYYSVHGQNGNESLFEIHASRIMRFTGPDVPTPEHEANQYWGISVLELVMEEMRKRDNASWSILQLLFRAQIMTQVNPELAQMLSGATTGGAALQKFAQTYKIQNELLSNQSMLILGKEGKLESHQYTFGGIAEVLDRFEIAVAASATPSIPYSKLFGKNSSGLDNSNDADELNYEEAIAQAQHDDLEPQLMQQLYPVICMSEFGDIPDDLDVTWPSIRVLTEEDKSKLAKEGGEAILAPFNAGVTSQRLTLEELKQLGDKIEIFSNITPKMIDEADDKPQAPIEVEQGEARAGSAEFEETGGANDGFDAAWIESDHDRDKGGKFSATSGQSTEAHYKGSNGYSNARKELHKQIFNKHFSGKVQSEKPTAYFLGGGSASGKSTGFKNSYAEKFRNELVNVDSDAIKEMLPEYKALKAANPELAAALVHEESSYLAKKILKFAAERKLNLVYDSTGGSRSLPAMTRDLKKKGYRVEAVYFDIPVEEALKRAEGRANRTGRHIPEEVVRGTHKASAAGFLNMASNENVDSTKLYNTIDRIPALVYTGNGGKKGVVVDVNKWEEYKKKAGF